MFGMVNTLKYVCSVCMMKDICAQLISWNMECVQISNLGDFGTGLLVIFHCDMPKNRPCCWCNSCMIHCYIIICFLKPLKYVAHKKIYLQVKSKIGGMLTPQLHYTCQTQGVLHFPFFVVAKLVKNCKKLNWYFLVCSRAMFEIFPDVFRYHFIQLSGSDCFELSRVHR